MEYRIGHLAYHTKDMEKSLKFYTEVLGFSHIFGIPDDKGNKWIEYIMGPDGRFIELFYPNENETIVEGGTYMHLCLEVDDCAAAVKELAEKGISSDVKQGSDGNYQAWIKDPDGRDIEIMQLVETSEQYQHRNGLK